MTQVIRTFNELVVDDGRRYVARVVGEDRGDGMWEGRIEFDASDDFLRTDRETTQPDLGALAYWATGLEPVYLEGALERARRYSRRIA